MTHKFSQRPFFQSHCISRNRETKEMRKLKKWYVENLSDRTQNHSQYRIVDTLPRKRQKGPKPRRQQYPRENFRVVWYKDETWCKEGHGLLKDRFCHDWWQGKQRVLLFSPSLLTVIEYSQVWLDAAAFLSINPSSISFSVSLPLFFCRVPYT